MVNGILLGVQKFQDKKTLHWTSQDSLNELEELALTANIKSQHIIIQNKDHIDRKSYLGKGKLLEVKDLIESSESIEIVISDDELTPNQQKHLEEVLCVKVIDRTGLILDIFASRAQTYEAQLQVELAQLEYNLPRLTRMWTHLSRQAGGIGLRGPGETQLEVDKRQIGKRISTIKKKIEKVKVQRNTTRTRRQEIPMLTGTIVGYTNAGKSTLINQLTKAGVLAEDKLFATLDPTTRRLELPNNEEILLTDTVGFIQKLPHQLVTAFRSTLEEAASAHFIIHVIDAAHPMLLQMIDTSTTILDDLGASEIPKLYVFNKCDKLNDLDQLKKNTEQFQPAIYISATNNKDLTEFKIALSVLLKQFRKTYHYEIPYSRMEISHLIHEHASINSEEFKETHIEINATLNKVTGDKIQAQLLKEKN